MYSSTVSNKVFSVSKTAEELNNIVVKKGNLNTFENDNACVDGMEMYYRDRHLRQCNIIFVTEELYFDEGIPFCVDDHSEFFYIKYNEYSNELFKFVDSLDMVLRLKQKLFSHIQEESCERYKV